MLHIYHGTGKGKTTAAFGMALRQLGHHKKVLILQFLKDGNSGEMRALKQFHDVSCYAQPLPQTFFYQMSEEEQRVCRLAQQESWKRAEEISDAYDYLVLDELLDAIHLKLLMEEQVLDFLRKNREKMEIVVTGRNPSQKMRLLADYDIEILSHKHPYEQGICARAGVEY